MVSIKSQVKTVSRSKGIDKEVVHNLYKTRRKKSRMQLITFPKQQGRSDVVLATLCISTAEDLTNVRPMDQYCLQQKIKGIEERGGGGGGGTPTLQSLLAPSQHILSTSERRHTHTHTLPNPGCNTCYITVKTVEETDMQEKNLDVELFFISPFWNLLFEREKCTSKAGKSRSLCGREKNGGEFQILQRLVNSCLKVLSTD